MSEVSLPLKEFDKARELFYGAKNILIISHRNPDPDTIGANLALRLQLEKIGKNVTSACADPSPDSCDFLPNNEHFIDNIKPSNYDLIIAVDCGAHVLLKFHEQFPELLDQEKTVLINIDHHATNDYFGTVNIVMDQCPATCFILFLMFSYYGWDSSKDIATCLLHGLYYDTGSFMHSNTSADTLRVAARLKAKGADLKTIVKKTIPHNKHSKVETLGESFEESHIEQKKCCHHSRNRFRL